MSPQTSCVAEEVLSAFVDGDLRGAEAETVTVHVAACAACGAACESLRALRTSLRMLAEAAPPRHVWPRIEAARAGHGRADGARVSRLRARLLVPIAALAGAAAAAVIIFVASPRAGDEPAHRREGDPSGPPTLAASRRAKSSAAVAVAKAEATYRGAIAGLKAALGPARAKWTPKARAAAERSLAEIDRAIERCRAAVRDHPHDTLSQEAMMAAYQQQVELLSELTEEQGS